MTDQKTASCALIIGVAEDFPMFGAEPVRSIPEDNPIAANEVRFGPLDAQRYHHLRHAQLVAETCSDGVASFSIDTAELDQHVAVEESVPPELVSVDSIPMSMAEIQVNVDRGRSGFCVPVQGVGTSGSSVRGNDTDVVEPDLDGHTAREMVRDTMASACAVANICIIV